MGEVEGRSGWGTQKDPGPAEGAGVRRLPSGAPRRPGSAAPQEPQEGRAQREGQSGLRLLCDGQGGRGGRLRLCGSCMREWNCEKCPPPKAERPSSESQAGNGPLRPSLVKEAPWGAGGAQRQQPLSPALMGGGGGADGLDVPDTTPSPNSPLEDAFPAFPLVS